MATDVFDQLSELDVPPAPEKFTQDLHERLNRSLTTHHVVDFGLNALPTAGMEFLRAMGGLIILTITGKYPPQK